MTKRLTTENIHKRDKASFWRDAISRSFVELDCDPLGNQLDFKGKILSANLGKGQVSQINTTAQDVNRSVNCIRKSDKDVFLLSLQLHGEGRIFQDAREAHLKPGHFSLYDSARPYRLLFENTFAQSVFVVPRSMALSYMPLAERLTALSLPMDSSVSRLASQYMTSINQELVSGACLNDDALLKSVMELLSTAYSQYVGEKREFSSTSRNAQLVRIKNFILENLCEPNLNPTVIAEVHGVSKRHVRKLFEEEEITLSRWIWLKRLERCRELIGNPRYRHLSLTEIALSSGFNDMSHFSKTFKAQFGMSPRQFRQELAK